MAIEELLSVVPPPRNPVEAGPLELLPAVERRALGTRLPLDIVEFGLRYGSGRFGYSIEIHNPFSTRYLELVHRASNCYQNLKADEGDELIPYDIYPTSPGLLAWGEEDNGHVFFWLTRGEPDDWPLVVMTADMQFQLMNMSVTTFLAKIFRGEMGCEHFWDIEFVRNNLVGIQFEPDTG